MLVGANRVKGSESSSMEKMSGGLSEARMENWGSEARSEEQEGREAAAGLGEELILVVDAVVEDMVIADVVVVDVLVVDVFVVDVVVVGVVLLVVSPSRKESTWWMTPLQARMSGSVTVAEASPVRTLNCWTSVSHTRARRPPAALWWRAVPGAISSVGRAVSLTTCRASREGEARREGRAPAGTFARASFEGRKTVKVFLQSEKSLMSWVLVGVFKMAVVQNTLNSGSVMMIL